MSMFYIQILLTLPGYNQHSILVYIILKMASFHFKNTRDVELDYTYMHEDALTVS